MNAGRTRILVTNQLHRLQETDRVFFIKNNAVQEQGTYADLMSAGTDFATLMDAMAITLRDDDAEGQSAAGKPGRDAPEPAVAKKREDGQEAAASKGVTAAGGDGEDGGLHEKEERNFGHVDKDVYLYYAKQASCGLLFCAIFFVSCQIWLPTGASFVLGIWTEQVAVGITAFVNATNGSVIPQQGDSGVDNSYFLMVYGTVLLGAFVAVFVGAAFMANVRVAVARGLHEKMLAKVLRAPVSYFDVTPLGRILNRFSKDVNMVDMNLTMMLNWTLVTVNFCISAFVVRE